MTPDTAAGCDGRDIRDAETYPEKIGPRCSQAHVIEITRKGWNRPVRLCRTHAERTCLTDDERVLLASVSRETVTVPLDRHTR